MKDRLWTRRWVWGEVRKGQDEWAGRKRRTQTGEGKSHGGGNRGSVKLDGRELVKTWAFEIVSSEKQFQRQTQSRMLGRMAAVEWGEAPARRTLGKLGSKGAGRHCLCGR